MRSTAPLWPALPSDQLVRAAALGTERPAELTAWLAHHPVATSPQEQVALATPTSPLCTAVTTRWRLVWALATRPTGPEAVDRHALELLLLEADEAATLLGVLMAESTDEQLRLVYDLLRDALTASTSDLVSALRTRARIVVQRTVEANQQKYAPVARKAKASVPRRPYARLGLTLAVCVIAAGAFHGSQPRVAQAPRGPVPGSVALAALPNGVVVFRAELPGSVSATSLTALAQTLQAQGSELVEVAPERWAIVSGEIAKLTRGTRVKP